MANEKKAFVLRVSAEMLKELERWAQEEFRSTNGQIEFLLSDALKKRRKSPGKLPPDVDPSDVNGI
ncbi:ribbon-helix-helix domain-containing protein [Runella aurantiaca]|uniref:Arc family DNA-binding protein n=1 Tax=Runella aurantiaca TaxID=2282308 RepID=A0A369ID84_9BACT|nr:Arc family DNA-binding protein [Runella aurantiaca]RDB04616.1 Arc family DNA-binding protein [Runella aurantiaca]